VKRAKLLNRWQRRTYKSCTRLIAGFVAVVTMPAIAAFFLLCAHAYADGVPGIPYSDAVEKLAGQNVAYWFLALAAITIASWTWVVKWIISQLDQQRKVNAEITQRLIAYMEKDHTDMKAVMQETLVTLRSLRPGSHE